MSDVFRVGLTRDFLSSNGSISFGDIGLRALDEAEGVEWDFLADDVRQLSPDHIRGYNALLVLAPQVTAETVAGAEKLAIVARFGVGYDNVDVPACTEHDVLLTITPDGVQRPVAVTALTLLLSLTHKLLIKDRMTRENRWNDKLNHMGQGVTGRTLGVIGLGSIGREVVRLAKPFDMRCVAFDPYVDESQAAELRVELLNLDELMAASDYVCICCSLTDQTHHLINAERIARMTQRAYLINVARGPIVDQQALTEALQVERIAGAGLDVFEKEPPEPTDPLLTLDNVILSPHALCWTDECFLGNGQSACSSILEVASGRIPNNVVNRDVLEHPRLREKLARFA